MVLTEVDSFNTKLQDRVLWYDGQSSFDPEQILSKISQYDIQFVTWLTPAIQQFNKHVTKDKRITVKQQCEQLDFSWNLPPPYDTLDVVQYIGDIHSTMGFDDLEQREQRLANELTLFFKLKLTNVLRTIIYIINTLIDHNIVWGVGRGSSVSSYVLYVIGVHDVDSYMYQLDIGDFLHD